MKHNRVRPATPGLSAALAAEEAAYAASQAAYTMSGGFASALFDTETACGRYILHAEAARLGVEVGVGDWEEAARASLLSRAEDARRAERRAAEKWEEARKRLALLED